MSIRVSPLDTKDPRWRALTLSGVGSTAFHCPTLTTAVCGAYGTEPRSWGAWDSGELVGGLTTLNPPGERIRPQPLVPFNGPVVKATGSSFQSVRDRHCSRVVGGLLAAVTESAPSSMIRVNPDIGDIRDAMDAGWMATTTFTYVLDLTDLDSTWNGMDRNRRRLVRKARDLGYRTSVMSGSDPRLPTVIDHLIELHRSQLGRYGQPPDVDPASWQQLFARLLESGVGHLCITSSPSDQPVAFQLCVAWGTCAGAVLTGSDPSHADNGANSLLRWDGAVALATDGITSLDLHGARNGPAGRFKASLGANLTPRWDLWRPDALPVPLGRRFSARVRRYGSRIAGVAQAVRRGVR